MRALVHAHSDWSYDGETPLADLARWGAGRGLAAILLTEHVNDFDADKMQRYVGEVEALSAEPCRLVPGLEFSIRGGFHVLGLNLRAWQRTVDPLETVRFIREHGGLAVLAHPVRYGGRWPADEVLAELHGIEVWNARYDGRFVPPGNLIAATRELSSRFAQLRFFGGQDLHVVSSHRLVSSHASDGLGVDGLLAALERGEATFGAPGFRLAGRPEASTHWTGLMKLGHRCYLAARRLRDRWTG